MRPAPTASSYHPSRRSTTPTGITRPEPMKPCIGLAKRADLIAALAARNGVLKGTHARNWSPYLYRLEEHTSELQSLMRISYAVFCLKTRTSPVYCLHKNKTPT